MQTISISSIIIPPDRQRKSHDQRKFDDLKRSILQEGLFHAIILTEGNVLVAGATRLRAISELATLQQVFQYNREPVPAGSVPFTFTHKTDAASLFRIELEENLRREQLSPVDEAQALARLHELVQSNAPEIIAGTGLKAPVTFKETAIELAKITGQPQTNDAQRIADSILVDKFKDLPEVKNAKSMGEAVRLARKAAERLFRDALGHMDVAAVESRHRVLGGDCATRLGDVADASVDVIIADPPYGIGADSFGEQSKVGHGYEDDESAYIAVMQAIASNANRICKPDAAMFIFLDILQFEETKRKLPAFIGMDGWYIWPTPLIWHKPNRGHAPQPQRGPSRRYEAILYAIRGNRTVRKVGSDVLSFNVPDDRSHGAGKPVDLYSELLSWHCYPGDCVLDPCAGSGTIIPAADALDLSAIAIEKDPASLTMIQEKLEKGK